MGGGKLLVEESTMREWQMNQPKASLRQQIVETKSTN